MAFFLLVQEISTQSIPKKPLKNIGFFRINTMSKTRFTCSPHPCPEIDHTVGHDGWSLGFYIRQ